MHHFRLFLLAHTRTNAQQLQCNWMQMQSGGILTASPTSLGLSEFFVFFFLFFFLPCKLNFRLINHPPHWWTVQSTHLQCHSNSPLLLHCFQTVEPSFWFFLHPNPPPRLIFGASLHCRFMFSFSHKTFIFALCISCFSQSYRQMQYCRSWRSENSFVRTLIYLCIYMC